jgi:hypothetical protein
MEGRVLRETFIASEIDGFLTTRNKLVGDAVHFWPFDGWAPPAGKAVIVEAYPSIFRNRYLREGRSGDEQDAYATARWMADMASRGALAGYFDPSLAPAERAVAAPEGWILGVQ